MPEDHETPKQPNPEPVAYDREGRPLYAHPPQPPAPNQAAPSPQVVYMARPLEPKAPHISEEVKKKCDQSRKHYPFLNLSDGEYVISAIRRHPIGLFSIWGVAGLIIVILLIAIPVIMNALSSRSFGADDGGGSFSLAIIFLMLSVLAFLGGLIATKVYNANRFFLTNESVIQHIQASLFSKKEQTISLANIEDASYRQHGIVEHIFNYGSLRLSTEGDETTYRFNYVAHPERQVTLLNNAVEAFKNGRPFGEQ